MPGSPYTHEVIGTDEDLAAMTLGDAQRFFDQYYTPQNAIMVLVGDLDFENARARVTHYFKDIPRGSQRPSSPTLAPTTDRVRAHVERRVEDPLAQQRLIRIGWRTVSFDEKDRAALDVLGAILGGGKTSRLYRRLIDDDPVATVAFAGHEAQRYDGGLSVMLLPLPGVSAEVIRDQVLAEIETLKKRGPTTKELDRVRRQRLTGTLFGLSTNLGRAMGIGQSVIMGDDPKLFIRMLEQLDTITPRDVQRVAKKYLDENFVMYEIVPEENKSPALPGVIR